MIPKVDCCVQAIEEGVTSVNIIDGRKPHSVLYEAFTNEGTGTTIGTAERRHQMVKHTPNFYYRRT